jgi:hypothetical protein
VVALAAAAAYLLHQPLVAAGVVLAGAVAVLADSVFQVARKARAKA